jgi:hypothetical protein
MKRFEIITERDARVLPLGDAVMLAKGGHITPLAQDTLADRRITVVHEGQASADEQSLAPAFPIRSWPRPRRSPGTRARTTARTC